MGATSQNTLLVQRALWAQVATQSLETLIAAAAAARDAAAPCNSSDMLWTAIVHAFRFIDEHTPSVSVVCHCLAIIAFACLFYLPHATACFLFPMPLFILVALLSCNVKCVCVRVYGVRVYGVRDTTTAHPRRL